MHQEPSPYRLRPRQCAAMAIGVSLILMIGPLCLAITTLDDRHVVTGWRAPSNLLPFAFGERLAMVFVILLGGVILAFWIYIWLRKWRKALW